MEKCIYCGEIATYQFKNKKWCCSKNMNFCPAIRNHRSKQTKLTWENKTRGKEKIVSVLNGINLCNSGCGKIAAYQLKGGTLCCEDKSAKCIANKKKNAAGQRIRYTKEPFHKWSFKLRRELVSKEQNGVCLYCKLNRWLGKELLLELDHINGDHYDNRRENLRLLCPNCHSLTDTYRGKGRNTGKIKISDEEIVNALKKPKYK